MRGLRRSGQGRVQVGRVVPVAGAAIIAAVMIGGLLLAGCTSASNSAGFGDEAPATAAAMGAGSDAGMATAPAVPAGPTEAGPSGAASSGSDNSSDPKASGSSGGASTSVGSGEAGGPIVDDRQIIRTAAVALQVVVPPGKDDQATTAALSAGASAAAVKVRALAPGTGGYVSASDGGGSTISVTLRVPAASYDTVMNGLTGIGEITNRTEKTDDVTAQMVDVASRIATMKASVTRVRALLAQADKIGDIISIESELTQREADLESLENRQSALQDQVALSTISVTITAVTPTKVAVVAAPERHGFLAGLAGGWHALLSFGTWLGSVVGALLPFLPVIAVVAAVALWISRRRRRATPEAAPAGDPAASP
jgi:hypothetical protein